MHKIQEMAQQKPSKDIQDFILLKANTIGCYLKLCIDTQGGKINWQSRKKNFFSSKNLSAVVSRWPWAEILWYGQSCPNFEIKDKTRISQTSSRVSWTVYQCFVVCIFLKSKSDSAQNARLDDSQAGIKIDGWNINNLRYADDITLMAKR